MKHNVRGDPSCKNYEFDYDFGGAWGQSSVIVTSAKGHIHKKEFHERYQKWHSCDPSALFEANIVSMVTDKSKVVAENIARQARFCRALFIWTDCDREGEHIGSEVRDIARGVNPNIQVKRARFHAYTYPIISNAARNPIDLDERQAEAVSARIELDLRLGAAFTRMQTLSLRPMIEHLAAESKMISYGSCQFPTLGFVVDRYFRVQNFVPETFWRIDVSHQRDGVNAKFKWNRVRLFDRMTTTIIFERCLAARTATVTKMETKPTTKYKPRPLTTVELQKAGTQFLRLTSNRTMQIAEKLYTQGWISYPRTETNLFDRTMDLRALVHKQTQSQTWGRYAQDLVSGGFSQPRGGNENDGAHPPIHPVNFVVPTRLSAEEQSVYEFIVRTFLACCSEDAKGQQTTCEISYGPPERFHTSGLQVLERNFLDVYPYWKWNDSQQLPVYTVGEVFEPTEAMMNEGQTSPPGYLTEVELLGMMQANGIGTDATISDHIQKIEDREYVKARPHVRRARDDQDGDAEMNDDDTNVLDDNNPRGGRGGRGRGRGRGGRAAGNGRAGGGGSSQREFIPTTLGVALIVGYDNLRFNTSLSKPFLRKEMEEHMKAICEGRMTKADVVHQSLEQYREVFVITTQQMDVLKAVSHLSMSC